MSILYNDVAQEILKDIDKFVPSKHNIEYRKNKSIDDLKKLVDVIVTKSSNAENNITILSVSLKNIFKKMRRRKYTMVYSIDGYVNHKFLNVSEEELKEIKNACSKDTMFISGHCSVDGHGEG
jgi:hypothetical protein